MEKKVLVAVVIAVGLVAASPRVQAQKHQRLSRIGFEPCDRYVRFLECYLKLLPLKRRAAFHGRYRKRISKLKQAYVREGGKDKAKKNLLRRCVAAYDMAKYSLEDDKVKRCVKEAKGKPKAGVLNSIPLKSLPSVTDHPG